MKIKRILLFIAIMLVAVSQPDPASAIQVFKGPHGETYIGDYLTDDLISKGYLSKKEWERRKLDTTTVLPQSGIGRPPEKESDSVQNIYNISQYFKSLQNTAYMLAFPDAPWAVSLRDTNFDLRNYKFDPKLEHAYFSMKNNNTQYGVSVYIDKIKNLNEKTKNEDCRKLYMDSAKNTIFNRPDLETSTLAGLPTAEYTFKVELDGVEFSKRHMHAFIARLPFCIEILLSKSEYMPLDRKTFENLLSSVKVVEPYSPTASMYLLWAKSYVRQSNLKDAERYVNNAIEALKKEDSVNKLFFEKQAILEQALLAALSGDNEKAKKSLTDGLSKFTNDPVFFYYLAAMNARMGAADDAFTNLANYYKFKNNLPANFEAPDPKNDPDFKKYQKDEKFLSIVLEDKK